MNVFPSIQRRVPQLANPGSSPPTLLEKYSLIRWASHVLAGLTISAGIGFAPPGLSAERVMVRFGPLHQSVSMEDLKTYAETGKVPSNLSNYRAFLNDDIRHALSSHLQLDPEVGDQLVNELLQSPAGERLLNLMEVVISESNEADLRETLMTAAQQAEGLSLLTFLQAYPQKTVTINGAAVIALASQMNLPYWQSQALSSILERELTLDTPKSVQTDLDPTTPGLRWVRQQTIILRDYDRDRTIPVDLYWTRRTEGPLIVISHGFGADRRFLGYLAYHLASHGFAVAALEHPGSNVARLTEISEGMARNGQFDDILPPSEFIERPKDISFLLDQLERMNLYSTVLYKKFNTEQVTIIGHSLGGATAFTVAGAKLDLGGLRQYCTGLGATGLSPADWLQCMAAELPDQLPDLQDPRIKQVLAFNPVMGRLFNEAGLAQVKVPTLILTSTNDRITPAVSQQLLPFTQLQSPKLLFTAIGATHLSVGDPANLNRALTESLFIKERRGEETEQLRKLTRGVSLAFVQQMTPEAKLYAPFLTPAYAQALSTPDLKLRLNSDLPPNLSNWLKMAALPLERLVANTLPRPSQDQDDNTIHLMVSGIMDKLPMVLFILSGSLHLPGHRFLKHCRRNRNRFGGN